MIQLVKLVDRLEAWIVREDWDLTWLLNLPVGWTKFIIIIHTPFQTLNVWLFENKITFFSATLMMSFYAMIQKNSGILA